MVCQGIEIANKTLSGFMQYPTSCNYYFYLEIMFGIWVILTFLIYYYESLKKTDPDWISAMGVSSIAIIFISLAGTQIKIISSDIFLYIIAWCFIWIIVWIFKK